jgi:hypothetical protein
LYFLFFFSICIIFFSLLSFCRSQTIGKFSKNLIGRNTCSLASYWFYFAEYFHISTLIICIIAGKQYCKYYFFLSACGYSPLNFYCPGLFAQRAQ